jgi:hypothetical protein
VRRVPSQEEQASRPRERSHTPASNGRILAPGSACCRHRLLLDCVCACVLFQLGQRMDPESGTHTTSSFIAFIASSRNATEVRVAFHSSRSVHPGTKSHEVKTRFRRTGRSLGERVEHGERERERQNTSTAGCVAATHMSSAEEMRVNACTSKTLASCGHAGRLGLFDRPHH